MSSKKITTKTMQVAKCANCKIKPVFHHLFDVCTECLKDCQQKMISDVEVMPFRLICAWCGVFPCEDNKEGEYEDACVFCELKDKFELKKPGDGDASNFPSERGERCEGCGGVFDATDEERRGYVNFCMCDNDD